MKSKYYQVYKTYGRTNLQRQEIRRIYRPKSFIWIGVEIVGLIISSAVLWLR
ncbi:MAG: hypothetical protein NC336_04825 [Clostridium sp.]|nr:hypothetical protein [Clostridium sp.]